MGIGHLRGFYNLLRRGVKAPIGNVIKDCSSKEHGILQDKTDLGAQRIQLVLGDINSINQDPPFDRIVKARNEAQYGGFTASGWATDTDSLARLYCEINVTQYRCLRGVSKRLRFSNTISPLILPGCRASGFCGMIVSA